MLWEKVWEQYSENHLRFWGKSAKILLYVYGAGEFISFCLRNYGRRTWLWQTEMRQLLSARLGSARQEHSAVFSACQVLFHTIYNEPIAGDRAHCALASAFAFAGRVVVWYWSPNHDRQIYLFRLNLLSSPAYPLSEKVKIADRIIWEEWKWRKNYLQSYSAL